MLQAARARQQLHRLDKEARKEGCRGMQGVRQGEKELGACVELKIGGD